MYCENVNKYHGAVKISPALNINMENINTAHPKSDLGDIQLSINIILKCGPDGKWTALKTTVENQASSLVGQHPLILGNKTLDPRKEGGGPNEPIKEIATARTKKWHVKPKPKLIWRPRSGPGQASGGPTQSE